MFDGPENDAEVAAVEAVTETEDKTRDRHPFYAAMERYAKAKADYLCDAGTDVDIEGRLGDECDAARDALLMTPLAKTKMVWALLEKIQILDSEMTDDALNGSMIWPRHLTWLGAIKADIASMEF